MFNRLLVAIDLDAAGSWSGLVAVARALAAAPGTKVTLAYVVPTHHLVGRAQLSALDLRKLLATARSQLLLIGREIGAADPPAVLVRSGHPASELTGMAEEAGAQLLIVGAGRHSIRDRLLGSTANHVVARAECSVLVAKPEPPS